MAYMTVEEVLVLARHGVLKQTSTNRALIEALGQDILGSLDDDDLYETFLIYVRDWKREKIGIREIEIAAALRKADDEALATADLIATMWVESQVDRIHAIALTPPKPAGMSVKAWWI